MKWVDSFYCNEHGYIVGGVEQIYRREANRSGSTFYQAWCGAIVGEVAIGNFDTFENAQKRVEQEHESREQQRRIQAEDFKRSIEEMSRAAEERRRAADERRAETLRRNELAQLRIDVREQILTEFRHGTWRQRWRFVFTGRWY